jgi:hypothetical protein
MVGRPERLRERLQGFAQPWEVACFFWIPALVVGFTGWYELHNRATLGDFPIFRAASKAVLHGNSPYVIPSHAALAKFDTFVYPPAAAFLFSPFALVPYTAAKVLMLVLSLASVFIALRFLGVVDWRCYGVAAVSMPVVSTVALGAFTSFLLLGAAATWRYRDREALTGFVGALTATSKLFLWPIGVWLLVTRRLRAAVVFVLAAIALVAGGWAAIGFAGLRSYPHLLHLLTDLEAHKSFSLVALLKLSGGHSPWPYWELSPRHRSSGCTTTRCSSSRSRCTARAFRRCGPFHWFSGWPRRPIPKGSPGASCWVWARSESSAHAWPSSTSRRSPAAGSSGRSPRNSDRFRDGSPRGGRSVRPQFRSDPRRGSSGTVRFGALGTATDSRSRPGRGHMRCRRSE